MTTITPPKKGSIEYNLQREFVELLFNLLGLPSIEDKDSLNKAMQDNKLKIALHPDTNEFAVMHGEDEEAEPLLIINTNHVIELVKANHPLKPTAEQFNNREASQLVELDEAIILNKIGQIVVAPYDDFTVKVYGYGDKADEIGDQVIELDATFYNERKISFYYTPFHKDKFIYRDELVSMIEVFNSFVQPVNLEVYPIYTYLDEQLGRVIEIEGMNTFEITVLDEGDIFGQGLVMEI